MTKADPHIIIKETEDHVDVPSLRGDPVVPVDKSWRARAFHEGHGGRLTMGAPKGGWPQFDEDGNRIGEGDMPTRSDVPSKGRKTETGEPQMVTPKGHSLICQDCADLAGMSEEYAILPPAQVGRCDNCHRPGRYRIQVETARFETLLERERGNTGS